VTLLPPFDKEDILQQFVDKIHSFRRKLFLKGKANLRQKILLEFPQFNNFNSKL